MKSLPLLQRAVVECQLSLMLNTDMPLVKGVLSSLYTYSSHLILFKMRHQTDNSLKLEKEESMSLSTAENLQ